MTDKITVEEYRAAYKKPPKFGNKITEYKGYKFRSKGECERWKELELLQIAGEICNLKRQTKHFLILDGFTVGTYTDDFNYLERYSTGRVYPSSQAAKIYQERYVVEDFKGDKTDLFQLKWNILHVMYAAAIKQGTMVFRITKKQRGRR